jgi:hypothetical protein
MTENNCNLCDSSSIVNKSVVKKSYSSPLIQVLLVRDEVLSAESIQNESNSGYYS